MLWRLWSAALRVLAEGSGGDCSVLRKSPEDPSTQYLMTLVPKTIEGMVLEPGSFLNIGYLDPLGEAFFEGRSRS